MALRVVAVVVMMSAGSTLFACQPKEPVSPSTTPAPAAACDKLAAHLMDVLQPDGAAPKTVETIRQAIAPRCLADRWTIDALECFDNAKAIDATDHCATLLTVEQRNAFEKALGDALKNAMTDSLDGKPEP